MSEAAARETITRLRRDVKQLLGEQDDLLTRNTALRASAEKAEAELLASTKRTTSAINDAMKAEAARDMATRGMRMALDACEEAQAERDKEAHARREERIQLEVAETERDRLRAMLDRAQEAGALTWNYSEDSSGLSVPSVAALAKAHADMARVVAEAERLRDSGYDGPFMGDATENLFAALRARDV